MSTHQQLLDEAQTLLDQLDALRAKPWPTPGGRRHDLVNQLGAEAHFARLNRLASLAFVRLRRRRDRFYPSAAEGRIGTNEP